MRRFCRPLCTQVGAMVCNFFLLFLVPAFVPDLVPCVPGLVPDHVPAVPGLVPGLVPVRVPAVPEPVTGLDPGTVPAYRKKQGYPLTKGRPRRMTGTEQKPLASYGDALVKQSPSGVIQWLNENRAALLNLQKERWINWQAIADMLASNGILNAAGKPPSAGTIKRAWYRVRKQPLPEIDLPSPQGGPSVLHNPESNNGLHNTTVLHNPEPAPDPAPVKSALSPILPEQRTRPRRTLATLRGMEQAAPPTAPATQTTASKPEPLNADDVLRDMGIEP